jgi:rhodanese-related sulfurtransferase
MKKIILLIATTIYIFGDFKAINAKELLKLQKQGVPVIDIRTPQEWQSRGIIKGAKKMMFFTPNGSADIANFMFNLGALIKDKSKPFIIYCAHANRSKELGRWLDKIGFKKVYELKGGIEYGWIDKGFKTQKINLQQK